MDQINQKLLDAIKENNEEIPESSEENANALQLIKHSFKGTFRLTFMAVLTIQLVCVGFGFYFGYHMLYEPELSMQINYLAGAILSAMAFAIARLFFFMELNRLSVIREVKRVELQLAVIAKAMDDRGTIKAE